MTDLPILFSAPMVRAILREIEQPGTGKTQTRRIVNFCGIENVKEFVRVAFDRGTRRPVYEMKEPRGKFASRPAGKGVVDYNWKAPYAVGDRLYVREAWHAARSLDGTPPRDIPRDADIEYAATARSYAEIGLKGKLRPAMFLPRRASRITLIVTDGRVQRLQEITNEDCIAEGIPVHPNKYAPRIGPVQDDFARQNGLISHYGAEFKQLWDGINAKRGYGWDCNPWVAAYTFRPILGNIDQVSA